MRKNACGPDRAARIVAGTALVALALGTSGGLRDRETELAPWQILATFAGGELLVTGLLQWCPGSYLLGVNTCASERWRPDRVADRARALLPSGEADRSDGAGAPLPTG